MSVHHHHQHHQCPFLHQNETGTDRVQIRRGRGQPQGQGGQDTILAFCQCEPAYKGLHLEPAANLSPLPPPCPLQPKQGSDMTSMGPYRDTDTHRNRDTETETERRGKIRPENCAPLATGTPTQAYTHTLIHSGQKTCAAHWHVPPPTP